MQRIYGTAFFSQKDLDAFLQQIEEAKKRDHRRLGKDLDLFSIQDDAGPGLIFWHPKGGVIRREIEDWLRDELTARGYDLVFTPHAMRLHLWEMSGHTNFYRENMFGAMDVENDQYQLKPMNCPGHILIYKSRARSYRELPMRLAELGTVYRYERSGVMHGLMRVRGFTQDDAHIFCMPEQLEAEVQACVEFAHLVLKTFGFDRISSGAFRPRSGGSRALRGNGGRMEPGGRRADEHPEAHGYSVQVHAGRSGFLWAQDRRQAGGCHRPARGSSPPCSLISTCRGASDWSTSGGRASAHAGDGASRLARVHRAILRSAD